MGRCPRCHRRLAAGTRCRQDGGEAGAAAASAELAGAMAAPHVPGLRVQRLLGAGGFASVWEAADGEHPVAIKVSHSSGAAVDERFAREAEALRRVGPPAVPALRGAGALPDQRSYLVMELVAGTALSTWLEERPDPPAWREAVALFRAVLDRVSLVHRAGLVHLDLKPENVFLAGDPPAATLIDLGLARAIGGARLPGTTDDGRDARAGTPEYMAPEQLRGEAASARADLYALGVVLHELLTGRPPFAGDRAAVEHGHLALRPPRSSAAGVPPPIDEVVLRCLAKDPAERFADAGALADALADAARAASAGPAPGAAETPADRTAPPPRREPVSRARAALLFCRAEPARLVDLRAALEASGGALAHVAGDAAAGAFTAATGEHPVRRAIAAARGLCERGVCERILVDLQAVVTMSRPGAPARLMSPLFTRPERYPAADDPPGVLLTAPARDALGADVAVDPIPGRADRVALRREPRAESTEATGFHRPVERMLGRDHTLEDLVGSARAAIAGRTPAIATVIGDQGLGKSHLAAVLVDRLATELAAIDVLALRASEPIAGDTDRFLALLLRHALGLGDLAGEAGRRRLEARLGAELAAEVHSAVALALGWVGADDPGVARLRATPGVLRAATARAIGEGLRRRALERPLCLVVDDAHWADPTSLDGLEYATADDARAPLWLAVIARTGLEQARPAWGTRAAHHLRERLGPLERGAAAALCRRLLAPAEHVPESVIDRLVDRSQANPLLLVDLVGGLRRQGLVQERPGGGATVVTELLDRMPDMAVVEWIAARAIDSLPPDLAAYGRLAALLGADFTDRELGGIAAELDRTGAGFRTDAGFALRQLCDAGLLVRHRDERYGLRSSLGRDAVAAAAPDELRRRVDRAALEFFRRAAGIESGRRLSRVALHAAAVGERDEAAAAYLELAERARARHAYLEADLLYTSALGSIDPQDGERRLGGLRGRGIVRYRLGRYDDSLADLRVAGALAGERGDRPLEADLLLDAAMALDWLEEWRESRELTRRAAELIQPRDPPLLRARLLQAEGRSANRFNQDTDGIRLYEEAIAVAEPLGDEAYEVLVTSLLLLGFVLPFVGRPDDAEACLERALALCQSTGDELHLGAVYNNRSCLWIALNDQRRALEDMDRARAYARRLGISNLERMVELNLGIYLYWLGELEQAEPHVERLIQLDQRRMRSGVRPDGQVLRARLRFARGDLDGCRRELAEIVHHQEEATRLHAPDVMLMPNDRVLFDAVSLAAGGGEDEAAWDAVCARADQVSQGQELIEVMELRGLAEARAGRADAARRAWHQALEVGARIPNVFEARLRRRLAELGPAGQALSPAPRR